MEYIIFDKKIKHQRTLTWDVNNKESMALHKDMNFVKIYDHKSVFILNSTDDQVTNF